MAWTLAQVGSKLYRVGTDYTATELSLPSGITLDTSKKLRMTLLGRTVVLVNGCSRNLAVDFDGTVRTLVPQPPPNPLFLGSGGAGSLTGTYRYRFTYAVKDRYGRLVAESPMSPYWVTAAAAINISVSYIGVSDDPSVNCRRIYRTTNGGTTYFLLRELDDNVTTSFVDSLSDAALSLYAQSNDSLGAPPGSAGAVGMSVCTAWKDRLWGAADYFSDSDNLRYSENREVWAWPEANYFPLSGIGSNGITALIPRRDDLAVCKRSGVYKIVGDSATTFQPVIVTVAAGAIAPDSVAVIRNVGYVLGEDGVYRFDDDGYKSISREKVHAWFTTDDYFNRARFPYAEAGWNPELDTYDLHLAAAGSTVLDRWVSYDLKRQVWTGPHKTDAFTIKGRSLLRSASGTLLPVVGGDDGYVYLMNQSTRTDKTATAISADVRLTLTADTPSIEKVWAAPDVLTRIESAGTLAMAAAVGDLASVYGTADSLDLTLGRQRGSILGPGRICRLKFTQATAAQDFMLMGLEVPYFELGRK